MPVTRPVVAALLLSAAFAFTGCRGSDADRVIDGSRRAHGAHVIDTATVSFDFRGDRYTASRSNGRFEYAREYHEDGALVREVMTNDSIYRLVDARSVQINDQQRRSIESQVNSVIYFALLPYNLGDDAVINRTLGTAEIKGEPYDVIEVTFREEGGGRDWQDRYVYWIHRERRTMDFLAYAFDDDEGGGSRFREAMNPRTVGGVRFQDYRNYTIDTLLVTLDTYPSYLESNDVELVSLIEIDDIDVR
jgi:hypothetical protein